MPTAQINGFQMYFEDHGQGEPFLWIHGGLGGGDGCEGFVRLHAAALGGRFRFITYDRRTAGRSETPPGGYSMAAFGEDAAALLRHVGVDRTHVLGSSAGGPIALTLALEHPEVVRTLHLVNTMTYASEPERRARREELDHALGAERSEGRAAAAESAILFRQPQLKTQDPARLARLARERAERWDGINRTIEAYLAIGDSIERRMGEIRQPTVITHGDADTTIPVRCGYDLHRLAAGSELHIIPGAVHGLTANEPDRTRAIAVDFIERVARRAAPGA